MSELEAKLLVHQFLLYLEDVKRYDSLARFLIPPLSRERMINGFLQYKEYMDEITGTEKQFRIKKARG